VGLSILQRAVPFVQLIRLPAVFSVWSNIIAAHLIATGGSPLWTLLLTQLGISTSLYWGGMVLNDCFDLAEDRLERPGRPLPSGQIPISIAWILGFGLLAVGLAMGARAGGSLLLLTLLLTLSILLYDGLAKRGPLGPAVMGLCRYLNWLIGLAAVPLCGVDLLLPLPVLFYTSVVTVMSRVEAGGVVRRSILVSAALLLLTVVVVTGLHIGGIQREAAALGGLALLLIALAATLWRAWRDPRPEEVQISVGHMLTGMIPLDAILLAGDGQWKAAFGLLLLLLPSRLLARRLYVT
jgi:4-hydroxybenzoate polyprenyltransferase